MLITWPGKKHRGSAGGRPSLARNQGRLRLQVERLEERSLPSTVHPAVVLPTVVMDQATTTDAANVRVTYDITGAPIVGQQLAFNIYQSSASNTRDLLLATATLSSTDLSVGHHANVPLTLQYVNSTGPHALVPDPFHEYIVVDADSNGAVQEASGSVNTTYFRKYLLGVISHGLEFPPSNTPPAWETSMANELVTIDHYNGAIPFNWAALSWLPAPGLAVFAGNVLALQVIATADQLAAGHAGDVVDLHFIGHSRGTVVVSQAMQDLVGTTDPALQGSYIKATLLDPHPANVSTITLASAFPLLLNTTVGAVVFQLYALVSLEAADPQVVIPQNVKSSEVYYQHTSFSAFSPLSLEFYLNLWGEGPSDGIINQSSSAIHWYSLTNVVDPHLGPIGHFEVPLWYELYVVDAGLAYKTP